MADVPVTGVRGPVDGRTLRLLIGSLLVYHGLYALTATVTNWDSQVYNLARLLVAARAGFWQITAWNSIRQVCFPWVFDATHLPFALLGFGYALPSYACLLGLVSTVYLCVRRRWGDETGLWAALSLLAMPTIPLQGTDTKNDLAIVFGVGCWWLALERFGHARRRVYLFFAALSLAFTFGVKTSAVPTCAALTVVTLWRLRRDSRSAAWFCVLFAPLLLLFGSVETYALTIRMFGNPFGPPELVDTDRNRHGVLGTIANFIRYYFGNLSLGIDGAEHQSPLHYALEGACRWLLRVLRINNLGYNPFFEDAHDQKMVFLKGGGDATSDYGLVGCLALLASTAFFLRARFRDPLWVLAASGFAVMMVMSRLIGWMQWNARFLCLSFTLFGVAWAVWVFAGPPHGRGFGRTLAGVVVIWSAVSVPFLSFNESPADILSFLSTRDEATFRVRPALRETYAEVLRLAAQNPHADWYLIAGQDAWTLAFLQHRNIRWHLTPHWNGFLDAVRKRRRPQGDVRVLLLERRLPADVPAEMIFDRPGAQIIRPLLDRLPAITEEDA